MSILTFILEHWISLLFGLISTGVLAYCKFLHSKFKKYKQLTEEKDGEAIREMIEEALIPVVGELEEANDKFEAIKLSYRYRLITLCEKYLNKGYLTPEEYHGLTEMWRVYHGLGGNSQAEDYYHKVEALPVHED